MQLMSRRRLLAALSSLTFVLAGALVVLALGPTAKAAIPTAPLRETFGPACGAASIDGVVDPSEWSGAATQTFQMISSSGAEPFTATLHVMNGGRYLYMGITVNDDEFSSIGDYLPQGDSFVIHFDQGTGSLFTLGNDVLAVAAGSPQFEDRYVYVENQVGSNQVDTLGGGAANGAGAASRVSELNHFELRHPLCSSDSLDYCLHPSELVGFRLRYLDAEADGSFGGAQYFPSSGTIPEADIVIGACAVADWRVTMPLVLAQNPSVPEAVSGAVSPAPGRPLKRLDRAARDTRFASGLPLASGPELGSPLQVGAALAAKPLAGIWSALGSGTDGPVYAVAVDGTYVYVGGSFTSVDGVPANHIARWDGSAWSALGAGVNDSVLAIAISDGELYAGGWFTEAGGAPALHIARWNGSTWSALGGGTDDAVYAIAVAGGVVYAGGPFVSAGSAAKASGIARWSGGVWSALDKGVSGIAGLDPYVTALTVSGSDLYVGGFFDSASGAPNTSYIARWNGNAWSALGSGTDDVVYSIVVTGGYVYAGGTFFSAGGVPDTNSIARWNGNAWSAMGTGTDNSVYALAVSGSTVYAGGWFDSAGGVPAANVAAWNGSAWSALGSGTDGANPSVAALAVRDALLYAGGSFSGAGGEPARRIAEWNPSPSADADLVSLALSAGVLDPEFAPGTTAYTAEVERGVASITVTPTASGPGAKIVVNGAPVASGSPSEPINLAFGANNIVVSVTAQDRVTTQTYTIQVTRNALRLYMPLVQR